MIFKVAIALLEIHKDEIMKRDNFEEIMDYLKNILPKIDALVLETLMKDVRNCLFYCKNALLTSPLFRFLIIPHIV